MKVLLDTCTLAELRRPDGNPAVRAAVMAIDDEDLFVSVLTVSEIAKDRRGNNFPKRRFGFTIVVSDLGP